MQIPVHNPTHNVVLNNHLVIPQHFILGTAIFEEQTHLLEADGLYLTYECLQAWECNTIDPSIPNRLFAFFNSGLHSGASQQHRHVQFLPIEEMRKGWEEITWQPLIDLMDTNAFGGKYIYLEISLIKSAK